MDSAKIAAKNKEIQTKIDKRDREKMKLRPLDKHYGQRFLQYDRTEVTQCYCGKQGVVKVNGIHVCSEHVKGSLT